MMINALQYIWQKIKNRRSLGIALTGRSCPTNSCLDKLLEKIMESGISNFKEESHHITFTCNGVECKMWDANKYYAWLQSGHIGSYSWDNSMPSLSVMVEFKKFISTHRNQSCNEVFNQLSSNG